MRCRNDIDDVNDVKDTEEMYEMLCCMQCRWSCRSSSWLSIIFRLLKRWLRVLKRGPYPTGPDGAQNASTTKAMIAFVSQAPGRLKFQEGLLSRGFGNPKCYLKKPLVSNLAGKSPEMELSLGKSALFKFHASTRGWENSNLQLEVYDCVYPSLLEAIRWASMRWSSHTNVGMDVHLRPILIRTSRG